MTSPSMTRFVDTPVVDRRNAELSWSHIAYAQALPAADVPVELHLFPATFHASWLIGQAEVSQRELQEQVQVLRRALAA